MVDTLRKIDEPPAYPLLRHPWIEPVGELHSAGDNGAAPQPQDQQLQELILLIGHELRTPLTAIVGFAELMLRRGNHDAQALSTIVTQARQMNRLIGDLIDSARLQVIDLQVQPSQTDLIAVARTTMEHAQLMSLRHQLRLESPNEPLEGWWDAGRLAQIFANLLSNAIKYSPAGGEVLLTIEEVGSEVWVSVEDHGLGIAPAALPHLFDRYYRAPETAGEVPGLGLGLHVTRALVQAHGGVMQVESLFGRGSVFSFTLPQWLPIPTSAKDQRLLSRRVGEQVLGAASVSPTTYTSPR